MIATDTAGGALSAAFTTRMQASFLDVSLTPEDVILFCRKVSGTWYTRDVTGLWVGMGDIEKRLAHQYGVSEGTEAEFTFSNAPRYTLSSAYSSGTTLNVYDYVADALYWDVQANDWIMISDYDHTEYRRVTAFGGSTISISEALDYGYAKDDTEIRFLFAIEPTADRLDPDDLYNGWIAVKAGFVDMSEWIWVFQGKVTRGQVSSQDTLTLIARDRVKELVEYEMTARVEFDDRGVASVPEPHPGNQGSGTISDITYNPGKLPDLLTTEAWDMTYQASETFEVEGSSTGVVGSANPQGETGQRTWTIEELANYGFEVTITEGAVPFAAGDQFRFWSRASGSVAVIPGSDGSFPTANPIDSSGLADLHPSSVVEYVLNELLEWEHENPETGTATDLLDATLLATVQARSQDYFCELRGAFDAGAHAIDIIDDALKPVLGWIYSTEDDHIGIQLYSPFMLNSPTSFDLSHDVDNSARTLNVLSVASEPMDVEAVRNRVVFRYDVGDSNKEVEQVDSDSETAYGSRSLVIRGEDFTDYDLSSRFLVTENIAKAAANRILRRYKDPVQRFTLRVHPNALLLELGDTPMLYARDVQFSARRLWVVGLRKNLFTRTVTIEAENGAHIDGKYFKWRDSVAPADPTGSAIWDSTGFIGSEGEERIFIWSDATIALDVRGDNDGVYDAKLGKPDAWGNYVEESFIWW